MTAKKRFSKERLTAVIEAFKAAGDPVRAIILPDGTRVLAGGDGVSEDDKGEEARRIEDLMDANMPRAGKAR